MLPAMVLCAGFGTRLRPLTDILPKPLLPVGDRPAVGHILHSLLSTGFGPIAMNTHHRAEAFRGALPDDVRVVHETEILGTAGGVRNAAGLLGSGDVLVWNGDVITEPDLQRFVQAHLGSTGLATLLAVPRPKGLGTLGLGEGGVVVRLRGETFGDEVDGADFLGIQILRASTRERLPVAGCLVGDVYLPALRAGERLDVHLHEGPWDDIGAPKALLQANLRWLARHGLRAWSSATARCDAAVELADSVVCDSATVEGEGRLERCLVLAGASLRGPARDVIAMPDGRVIEAA